MNEDQLRAFIERQEARAARTDVATEQALAIDYYLRKPFGNEEEGRSQVISSDVWDVVEGMTPILLKPFVSSSDVVQFNPRGAEDEEAAKQETDYLNYVVTQRNDSFIQFVAWAKSGLLQKNGIVKYWWDKTRRVSIENYDAVPEDVLALMLQDEGVTVLEKSVCDSEPAQIDPQTGQPIPAPVCYDVRLRVAQEEGKARYEVIPPEEFLIVGRDPNPQNAEFVEHRRRVTVSDLREMGYDVADDISDAGAGDSSMDLQSTARNQNREFDQQGASDGSGDPSMREVWYREAIARVDFDSDGIAELRKVCIVGTTVLANQEVEEVNFCAWTPYQQLHQFDGRCPADETIEIQEVKSTLWRQTLDNIYTINNNRVFAGSRVNLDDLLDNQIAGIVRVDGDVVGNQVMSMPITPIGQVVQPMIEYMDTAKENRTGFTRYNQGNDADSLNKTATGVRLITQAGNERLALVQRSLAEQGMKPLMLGLHGLLRRHATKAETVRLRGKWVQIDPRAWKNRYDMTVSVGLGTMDKSMELQAQDAIVKMQQGLMPAGVVSPENIYNAAAKFVELTGEKNNDRYFTHPDQMPKPPPPNPMENPEVMFKVAEQKLARDKFEREAEQKDRELDQKDAALGIDKLNAKISALERHQRLSMDAMTHRQQMAGGVPQPGVTPEPTPEVMPEMMQPPMEPMQQPQGFDGQA